jgi:hypothetical protein
MSRDASHVAFGNNLGTLLHNDSYGNIEVFLFDRLGCSSTVATYCVAGTTSHGCVPSISGAGTPSASAGSGFLIEVSSLEGQREGLVFYGISGPALTPFGGGSSFLCVNHPQQRTGALSSGGTAGSCDGHLAVDWNHFIAVHGGVGVPFFGTETVWAQAWFRDPGASGGTNLSNALWFTVCP